MWSSGCSQPTGQGRKCERREASALDREIERLDEGTRRLKHNASFGETVELYKTVPGVLTAATLVAYSRAVGRTDATSLVGSVVARQREEAWQPVYSIVVRWSAVYLRMGGAPIYATSTNVFGSAANPAR